MKTLLLALLTLSLLTACTATPTVTPTAGPAGAAPSTELTRTDAQGAVKFAVTPLNLQTDAAKLEFTLTMDTHTVDLGWDLATQARLVTDIGREVAASQWTKGSGHHYQSTLVFPAQTADGQALLQSANTLTLVIANTDVPERTFVWNIHP